MREGEDIERGLRPLSGLAPGQVKQLERKASGIEGGWIPEQVGNDGMVVRGTRFFAALRMTERAKGLPRLPTNVGMARNDRTGKGLFIHGAALKVRRHLFDGVAEGGAGHGRFVLHDVVEDFRLMWFAGFLEHPAITFLDKVVGVGEEAIGDEEDIGEEFALAGGENEGDSGGTAEPAVSGLSPLLEVGQELRVFFDKGAEGVVAEGIAGGPVGDILREPALEGGEVGRGEVVAETVGPGAGDEGLLDEGRLEEVFTEGENPGLAEGLDLGVEAAGDLLDGGGPDAVEGDGLFEEAAVGGDGLFIGL